MLSLRALTPLLIALPLLPSCAATPRPVTETKRDDVSNFAFHVGERALDDAWAPVDDQQVVGLTFDSHNPGEFLGFEASAFFSGGYEDDVVIGEGAAADEYEISGGTAEIAIGLRKTFGGPHHRIRPYVGLGLAYINAGLESELEDDSDVDEDEADISTGLYGHIGFYWMVTTHFTVGADYRLLRATDVDDFRGFEGVGRIEDVDYDQITLTIGFGF